MNRMSCDIQTMDIIPDMLEYLRTVDGIIDACEMDDGISIAVWEIERNTTTTLNSDYRNVGYEVAMKRKHRVCVFYDDTYIFGTRSILKMVAPDGTVMGTTVNPDEMESFRARDDVIWISEDFVLFPQAVGETEGAFVLYPVPIHEIEENVPGSYDAIGVSPTTSSDIVLKKRFGKPAVTGMYTMVIAFDS